MTDQTPRQYSVTEEQVLHNQPLRIGPPRFHAYGTGMGNLEVIDPISIDATLNSAVCEDPDCDCDRQPVYLVMIEVEVTKVEYDRLCGLPGWVDSEDDGDHWEDGHDA